MNYILTLTPNPSITLVSPQSDQDLAKFPTDDLVTVLGVLRFNGHECGDHFQVRPGRGGWGGSRGWTSQGGLA